MENTIYLPDGYNGDMMRFYKTPIEEKGNTVKLRCAEKGKEYLTRWVYKSEIESK
jgi:hypothetical protein